MTTATPLSIPRRHHDLLANEVEVSPTLAEHWLETYNVSNYRPLDRRRVDRFAGLLTRGEFHRTGEPIQFSGRLGQPGCRLENGQHRLAGIVASGIPATLLVVEGVAPEAMLFMDTGKPRKFSDYLRHLGDPDYRYIAAAVRLGVQLEYNRVSARDSGGHMPIEFDELLAFYNANRPGLHDALSTARKIASETHMSRTAATVMMWRLRQIDPEDAEAFADALISGADLPAGDPILALRRWLLNSTHTTPRPRPGMQLAFGFKAWNAARAGRTLHHLRWRTVGSQAEGFPHPR